MYRTAFIFLLAASLGCFPATRSHAQKPNADGKSKIERANSQTLNPQPHWRDYLKESLELRIDVTIVRGPNQGGLQPEFGEWRPSVVLVSALDNLEATASENDIMRIQKRIVASEITQIQQFDSTTSKEAVNKLRMAATADQKRLQRDLREIQRRSELQRWDNPDVLQLIRRIRAQLKNPCRPDSTFGKVKATLSKDGDSNVTNP